MLNNKLNFTTCSLAMEAVYTNKFMVVFVLDCHLIRICEKKLECNDTRIEVFLLAKLS